MVTDIANPRCLPTDLYPKRVTESSAHPPRDGTDAVGESAQLK